MQLLTFHFSLSSLSLPLSLSSEFSPQGVKADSSLQVRKTQHQTSFSFTISLLLHCNKRIKEFFPLVCLLFRNLSLPCSSYLKFFLEDFFPILLRKISSKELKSSWGFHFLSLGGVLNKWGEERLR